MVYITGVLFWLRRSLVIGSRLRQSQVREFYFFFFFSSRRRHTRCSREFRRVLFRSSTTRSSVFSRSSWYVFTNGWPIRADTFQSIARKSSPCWYSRTSANSMPCPRNIDRYSPVKRELTRERVRSSMPLTCRSTSGVTRRRRARSGEVSALRRSLPSYLTARPRPRGSRSEEHTSELQSRLHLVCRLLLEKKKKIKYQNVTTH